MTPRRTTHADAERTLTLVERIRYQFTRWHLALSRLRAEMRSVAAWLEQNALSDARRRRVATVQLLVDRMGLIRLASPPSALMGSSLSRAMPNDPPTADAAFNCPRLVSMLTALDIERIDLDSRLTCDHLESIFILLMTLRKSMQRPTPSPLMQRLKQAGIHFAGTHAHLAERTLVLRYRYCREPISRVLHALERSNPRLTGHRSLYRAARRYAIFGATIVLIPVALHFITDSASAFIAIAVIEATLVFSLIYFLLTTIASVEYDNEEKAHRLTDAYIHLRQFTDRVHDDIKRAQAVQQNLLPDMEHMPLPDQLEWAARFQPQTEVGGDYYDVLAVHPNRVAMIFSDVSGHGMGAAFVTAILKTTFQTWADQSQDLADLVRRLNRILYRLTPDDSFAAVFVAIYDTVTADLSYRKCGHQPEPWLFTSTCDPSADGDTSVATRRAILLDDARAMLLGVMPDVPIVITQRTLHVGDLLLFASDGLIEARNGEHRMYSFERFNRFLAMLPIEKTTTAQSLVDAAFAEIEAWSADAAPSDDRTALAMRVLPT